MRLVQSVDEFNKAIGEAPRQDTLLNNRLYMKGAVFRSVSSQDSMPIYEASAQIERIVKESFPDCQVDGMQLAPHENEELTDRTGIKTVDWRRSRLDYQGMVYAICGDEVIAEVQLYIHKATGTDQTPLIFEAHLSTDGSLQRTQDTVTRLWPIIQGFEFAKPNIPETAEQTEKYGAGKIVLFKDELPIATGLPAIKEIGLNLPDKSVLLVECCYYL